jgi:C6 transcription factor Pro1
MMIEAFLWFDVLASSSNRDRQPLLGQYHEKLLGNDAINCASISGCQNWAVLQMSRVSRLASWKRDSENSGLLSIMDLTKRAMTIEEDIKKGLKALSNNALETSPSSPEQRELSNVTCITKVFALSIVTYLHVVISGAHPELQEIKECVSRTIEDLNQVALKRPQLLKSLIWPICVNGCLATEAQESVVKSVVKSLTESRPHIVGSNLTVSRVIEECWKLRKSEAQGSWDWRTTAGKINQRVLLV